MSQEINVETPRSSRISRASWQKDAKKTQKENARTNLNIADQQMCFFLEDLTIIGKQ